MLAEPPPPPTESVDDDLVQRKLWIPNDRLEWQLCLGRGANGMVFAGRERDMGPVAIKTIKQVAGSKESLTQEIKVASELKHRNICQFYGLSAGSPPNSSEVMWLLITERCDCSLWKLIHNGKRLRWRARVKLAKDIAQGMNYLHGHAQSAHLDLKSDNVLVSHDTAKIADFGSIRTAQREKIIKLATPPTPESRLAAAAAAAAEPRHGLLGRHSDGPPTSGIVGVGTPEWMAPEVTGWMTEKESLNISPSDITSLQPADVYSFSIVCWELLTRRRPLDGFGPYADTVKIPMWVGLHAARPVFPVECCPPLWVALCEQCWKQDASERPTFAMVLSDLEPMLECWQHTKACTKQACSAECIERLKAREDWPENSRPLDLHFSDRGATEVALECPSGGLAVVGHVDTTRGVGDGDREGGDGGATVPLSL